MGAAASVSSSHQNPKHGKVDDREESDPYSSTEAVTSAGQLFPAQKRASLSLRREQQERLSENVPRSDSTRVSIGDRLVTKSTHSERLLVPLLRTLSHDPSKENRADPGYMSVKNLALRHAYSRGPSTIHDDDDRGSEHHDGPPSDLVFGMLCSDLVASSHLARGEIPPVPSLAGKGELMSKKVGRPGAGAYADLPSPRTPRIPYEPSIVEEDAGEGNDNNVPLTQAASFTLKQTSASNSWLERISPPLTLSAVPSPTHSGMGSPVDTSGQRMFPPSSPISSGDRAPLPFPLKQPKLKFARDGGDQLSYPASPPRELPPLQLPPGRIARGASIAGSPAEPSSPIASENSRENSVSAPSASQLHHHGSVSSGPSSPSGRASGSGRLISVPPLRTQPTEESHTPVVSSPPSGVSHSSHGTSAAHEDLLSKTLPVKMGSPSSSRSSLPGSLSATVKSPEALKASPQRLRLSIDLGWKPPDASGLGTTTPLVNGCSVTVKPIPQRPFLGDLARKGKGGSPVSPTMSEEDWIAVDDGAYPDMTPRFTKVDAGGQKMQLSLNSSLERKESYHFTKSGTIWLKGFGAQIGECGLGEQAASAGIPMQERLVMLQKLGQGASGVVFKAFDLVELRLVAVKVMPVNDKDKRRQMVSELCALYESLRSTGNANGHNAASESVSADGCDQVVEFFDAFATMGDATVGLLVEFMDGGSLQDLADEGGCRDETTLAQIALQGLRGLTFLHNHRQIHRDLKPANMLINHKGQVKISDFGIARKVGGPDDNHAPETAGKSQPSHPSGSEPSGSAGSVNSHPPPRPMLHTANTFVGTVTYMSPERINGEAYSYASDVWSLGLSLLTTALGHLPLDTKGGYWSVYSAIRDAAPPTLPASEAWSPALRSFIDLCLTKDPSKRPSCAELLEHQFVKGVVTQASPSSGGLEEDQLRQLKLMELEEVLLAVAVAVQRLLSAAEGQPQPSGNVTPAKRRLLRRADSLHGLFLDDSRAEKLKRLASQLSLPLDVVTARVKEMLGKVEAEISNGTPKAAAVS